MAGRTHAGPMDFEYQNGTGPVDERSPFAQIGRNQRNNNTRSNSNSNSNNNNDKKRRLLFLAMMDDDLSSRWLMQ